MEHILRGLHRSRKNITERSRRLEIGDVEHGKAGHDQPTGEGKQEGYGQKFQYRSRTWKEESKLDSS